MSKANNRSYGDRTPFFKVYLRHAMTDLKLFIFFFKLFTYKTGRYFDNAKHGQITDLEAKTDAFGLKSLAQ